AARNGFLACRRGALWRRFANKLACGARPPTEADPRGCLLQREGKRGVGYLCHAARHGCKRVLRNQAIPPTLMERNSGGDNSGLCAGSSGRSMRIAPQYVARKGAMGAGHAERRSPLARALAGALSGAVLMQLAGCSRDPFAPPPAFPIPPQFESANSSKPPHVSRWWSRFGSRELDSLMESANVDNLDIAAAVAQLEQADALARVAAAPLWPMFGYSETNARS